MSLKELLAVCGGDDGASDVYEDAIWTLPLDVPGLQRDRFGDTEPQIQHQLHEGRTAASTLRRA